MTDKIFNDKNNTVVFHPLSLFFLIMRFANTFRKIMLVCGIMADALSLKFCKCKYA